MERGTTPLPEIMFSFYKWKFHLFNTKKSKPKLRVFGAVNSGGGLGLIKIEKWFTAASQLFTIDQKQQLLP